MQLDGMPSEDQTYVAVHRIVRSDQDPRRFELAERVWPAAADRTGGPVALSFPSRPISPTAHRARAILVGQPARSRISSATSRIGRSSFVTTKSGSELASRIF